MIPLVVGCAHKNDDVSSEQDDEWGDEWSDAEDEDGDPCPAGYTYYDDGICRPSEDTGESDADADDVEEAGILRVTPETLDFGTIATTSTGKMNAFAVINEGAANLLVESVTITDSGENTGFEVFSNLRRADSGEGTEFTLAPGEQKEFTVVAMGSEPMEAEGNIEISTDDTTIDDEGIGKYQLKLVVKVLSPT